MEKFIGYRIIEVWLQSSGYFIIKKKDCNLELNRGYDQNAYDMSRLPKSTWAFTRHGGWDQRCSCFALWNMMM